jgi:lipopolysaccharide export LptBFGC system permease protein LptF
MPQIVAVTVMPMAMLLGTLLAMQRLSGESEITAMKAGGAEIADIVHSGQLTQTELRKYVTTYQEKLAQPFACFVFVLIAIPYGLRAARSGGGTSVGFGLAVAIVFVYYIVLTVFSFVSEALIGLAPLWAWMPNIIFTAIGVARLRRTASV